MFLSGFGYSFARSRCPSARSKQETRNDRGEAGVVVSAGMGHDLSRSIRCISAV